MKKKYLFVCFCTFLSFNLNAQITNSLGVEKVEDIKRKNSFFLEEIKVRWKKAALENCTGTPCIIASFTCGNSTITDIDGNIYNTVSIGTQCWMKENLKVTKYNDGFDVTLDNSGGSSGNGIGETWSTKTTGAFAVYNNQSTTGTNAINLGFLYNWYAAAGITGGISNKNICPIGWHVPSDAEWTTMIRFFDSSASSTATNVQSSSAGDRLKSSSSLWTSSSATGNNSSGFTAQPGGRREDNGQFNSNGANAFYWSSTESSTNANNAWRRHLNRTNAEVRRNEILKQQGYAIRCIKD